MELRIRESNYEYDGCGGAHITKGNNEHEKQR